MSILSPVAAILLMLVLSLPSSGRGQDIPRVIVGDSDVVFSVSLCDPSCGANQQITSNNSKFREEASLYGYPYSSIITRFLPTAVGVQFDSLHIQIWSFNSRCCDSRNYIQPIVAYGISDSLVRIRPREWTMDLIGDTLHRGWFGSGLPLFDNNIADTTTFSKWTIESDSLHKFTLRVFDGMKEISSYRAKPFQRNLRLRYEVSAAHGPERNTELVNVQVFVNVQSGSRIFTDTSHIQLRIAPEPFAWHTTVFPDSIHFFSTSKVADSAIIRIASAEHVNKFTYSVVSLPFKMRELARSSDSISFMVTAAASGGGEYSDDLVVYGTQTDLNGADRQDSIHVPLRLSVTLVNDPTYWEATSAIDTGILALSTSLTKVFASFPAGALASEDQGRSWSKVYGPVDSGTYVYQTDDSDRLYTIDEFSLYYLFPGQSWHSRPNVIRDSQLYGYQGALSVASFLVTSNGELFVVGSFVAERPRGNNGYEWQERRSRDLGNSWTGFPYSSFESGDMPDCARTILFDSSENSLLPGCHLYISRVTAQTAASNAVDVDGNYYAGVSNQLYRSTDLGYSWSRLHLFGAPISSIAASPDGSVWVGTRGTGVYFSSDRGISFSGVNGGLGSLDVSCLNVQRGGRLYAGTRDKGVFRSLATMPLSQLGVQRSKQSPVTFAISPNPSRGSVTATIDMPRSSSGILQIYDLLGRQVMTKATEFHSGSNTLNLDLSTLVAGTHFIRLESGRSVLTQKLLISK